MLGPYNCSCLAKAAAKLWRRMQPHASRYGLRGMRLDVGRALLLREVRVRARLGLGSELWLCEACCWERGVSSGCAG